MEVQVNKIFNGFSSVRDYIVKRCVAMGQDLVIKHKGDIMVVPYNVIKDPKFQIHKTKFISKYDESQSYELYDFKWHPNNQSKLL